MWGRGGPRLRRARPWPPRVSRAASDTRLLGSQIRALEADPSVLSLKPSSLGAHLLTPLPAACASSSSGSGAPDRKTRSQLRSAAQPNCGPRPRRRPASGRCRTALGFHWTGRPGWAVPQIVLWLVEVAFNPVSSRCACPAEISAGSVFSVSVRLVSLSTLSPGPGAPDDYWAKRPVPLFLKRGSSSSTTERQRRKTQPQSRRAHRSVFGVRLCQDTYLKTFFELLCTLKLKINS